MNAKKLADLIIDDLKNVASHGPNERMPQEEQVRCTVFNYLKPLSAVVCAEKGFKSIDDAGKAKCDLWAHGKDDSISWIEIKTCWAYPRANIRPDQIDKWNIDLKRLSSETKTDRYFILVGFFDSDPLGPMDNFTNPKRKAIVNKVHSIHPKMCIAKKSEMFSWRPKSIYSKSITHLGVWIWHWPKGVKIGKI
jgi:glycerol-3-phosphate cytidylyltransferase-like family protein